MVADQNVSGATYNYTPIVHGKIVSDYVFYVFEIVFYVILVGLVSMCDIVANIINILVFVKQGLMSDSSNVSLCGLAVADLCCLVCLLWMSTCWALVLVDLRGLNWDPHSVMYMTAGHPYMVFSNITSAISAYIAIERCICAVFPFKVTSLFSPKRSLVIVCCISLYFLSSSLPLLLTLRLGWVRNPMTNNSMLVLQVLNYYEEIVAVTPYINSVIPRTSTTLIVLVCTKITAHRVKSSMNWRKSVSNTVNVENTRMASSTESTRAQNLLKISTDVSSLNGQFRDTAAMNNPIKNNQERHKLEAKMSSKESTLVRMITMISVIFIVCTTPNVCVSFALLSVPEIKNFGRYHNLFFVLYSIRFFIEAINSSVNIFVYYKISTKYRRVFRTLLCLERDGTNDTS